MNRVTTYLTATDAPSLIDRIGELQSRVAFLHHVSIAYGPTPEGAVNPHAWYALVIYDYDDEPNARPYKLGDCPACKERGSLACELCDDPSGWPA